MENVKNDAICHLTRQNQYNPAGGGATINKKSHLIIIILDFPDGESSISLNKQGYDLSMSQVQSLVQANNCVRKF